MWSEVWEMRYRIAVLGDRDSVMGFRALGLEVCPVSTLEEAGAARAVRADCACPRGRDRV